MYYIYERSSTYIIGKPDRHGIARPDHRQYYKTMPAAKAALTRLTKAWRANALSNYDSLDNDPTFRYGISEADYFHKNIEKSRTVKNMMNGADIVETVNTPGYMSPRSEAYWSM
jgi:hypothetical protein